MPISKCALGVIQGRGWQIVAPKLVDLGVAEADYVWRHVRKVRSLDQTASRCLFAASSSAPAQLSILQTTTSDGEFEEVAGRLQVALANTMKASTNALDCVFAVIRASDHEGGEAHITFLKLDAIVEAARMELENGNISLEVLEELLPEPGKLQKALSWPDIRPQSDVIMIDRNATSAQYFENAFQVLTSVKSVEAEATLHSMIVESVDTQKLTEVFEAVSTLSGPMDEVLEVLAGDYPELEADWISASVDPRPTGIIRPNLLSARPIIWRADGVELKVPPNMAGTVAVEQISGGWKLSVETQVQPTKGH